MYTTIIHPIRKALNLSLIDYVILEEIRALSNSSNKFNGWCIKSKDNMADSLDLGRATVYRSITTLEEKDLVERACNGYLRCTNEWLEIVADKDNWSIANRKIAMMNPETIKNSETHSLKMIPSPSQNDTPDSLKMIHKNNIENNSKNINNNKKDLELFGNFRAKYLGKKRGCETEFNNFKKKHKDWKQVLPTLEDIIDNQIQSKARDKLLGKFVPEWKNLPTWINNRCWEEEYGVITPFLERTLDQHYEEYVSYDLPFDHFRKYNRDKMESKPLRELAFKLENILSNDPKYK